MAQPTHHISHSYSCGEPEYLDQFSHNDSLTGIILRTNTDLSLALGSFTFCGAAKWNSVPPTAKI